jgi:hypothetical protein
VRPDVKYAERSTCSGATHARACRPDAVPRSHVPFDTVAVVDNGWAVVIGASIALIGSAVVPWVRESLQARGTAARKRESDIASALTKLGTTLGAASAAMVMQNEKGAYNIAMAWAVCLELELLLKPTEKDIATLGREAVRAVLAHDGRPSLAAYSEAAAAWHRDRMAPAAALELFRTTLTPAP